MWTFAISGVVMLLSFLDLVQCQSDPGFKHELPPGVELVNPKDFGLTDDQLGGLLSNVKVLGGSQIGDTKTQILTVGFEGDEDLNFDDFEIPGLTDKKANNSADKDKEKEIANMAFEKFKEYFKDPKKNNDKTLDTENLNNQPQIFNPPQQQQQPKNQRPNNQPPELRQRNNIPQVNQNQQYHKLLRPSSEALQQHYPVTLTQPSQNQHRPLQQVQIHVQQQQPQPPRTRPQQQQQHQPHPQHNYNNAPQQNVQSQSAPQSSPVRQSNHAIAFTNNNNNQIPTRQNFPTSPLPPVSNHRPNYNYQQHKSQFNTPQNQINQQPTKYQSDNNFPPGSFQRFTLFPPTQTPTTSPPPIYPSPQSTSSAESLGKVVRNQLAINLNPNPANYQQHQNVRPTLPRQHQQEYRTIDQTHYPQPPPSLQNPSTAQTSSVPSVAEDPQQRAVSHVFIQHQNHQNPVQQTSFHPRFQPPTKFSNDFTPSINQITTPAPHFDVTPSMPMILLSTNENAITDPKRMHNLRQQQRQMEERKKIQKESSFSKQPEQLLRKPHFLKFNNQQTTQAPRNYYQQPQQHSANNQQQFQQNSFVDFQTQAQQHQLHTLQQSPFFNNQNFPYYQQLAQASTNQFQQVQAFPPEITLDIQPPPPPNFNHNSFPHIRPEHYGTRHKRGYRYRLSTLLRGLLTD